MITQPPRPWTKPPEAAGGIVIVEDTETTGLPHEPGTEIVEIAATAVDIHTGEERGTFTSVVAPSAVLSQVHRSVLATVCKIPLEEILLARDARTVGADFLVWRARVAPLAPVTSFKTDFDRFFTERLGVTDLPWTACVQALTYDVFGESGRNGWGPTLAKSATLCGVTPWLPAHRALSDARTAAAVLLHLACLDFRPQHRNLARSPMHAWWSDMDTSFHIADRHGGPPFPSAAAEALVTFARRVRTPVNPTWYTEPPPDLCLLVPNDVWAGIYLRRCLRVPALRAALLHFPAGPLDGHPRAHIWSGIRDLLRDDPPAPTDQPPVSAEETSP